MRRKDFIELPLNVYAEYAANLSPKAMDLLLRNRKRACAAVFIQYWVRKWLSHRFRIAVFSVYIFTVWRRMCFKSKWSGAGIIISACWRRVLAQSLLSGLKKKHESIIAIVSFIQRYAAQISLTTKRRITSMSEPFGEAKAGLERGSHSLLLGRKKIHKPVIIAPQNIVLGTVQESLEVPVVLAARKRRARAFSEDLFLGGLDGDVNDRKKEELPNRPLNDVEIRAGKTILFALRWRIKRRKFLSLKLKILLRLVTRLQAIFRGAKVRRILGKEREQVLKEKKRKAELEKMKLEIALNAKQKEVEEKERQERLKIRKQLLLDAARVNNLSVPSALAQVFDSTADESLPNATEKEDLDELYGPQRKAMRYVKSKIFAFLCQHSLLWLKANALVLSVVSQTFQASQMKDDAAHDADESLIELEPVDILIPKDVQGLLSEGVVVDATSPIHGSKVEEVFDSWVVDELTDTEQYDLQYEALKNSALKIQRVYRRHLVRRKFLAYLNEKDLNTVREEEQAVAQAHQDAVERGEEPPPPPTSDAVTTDGCSVM